jgi:hypothetical protein
MIGAQCITNWSHGELKIRQKKGRVVVVESEAVFSIDCTFWGMGSLEGYILSKGVSKELFVLGS